jgi:hypothetical protein
MLPIVSMTKPTFYQQNNYVQILRCLNFQITEFSNFQIFFPSRAFL